ncbi:transcription factor SPT20 homolog isoform X2 [Halyomorpha halys]|uniref:transcription factor SPT20 homolog isoform X2 n=1 Tax=Halyomorpha halys TaxID=286706 RepID=UPI0006D4EA23|nr:transcription factor SPT20 homolog isoform X2 [Halyomorpha halys]
MDLNYFMTIAVFKKSDINVSQNFIDKSCRNQEIQYEGSKKPWPKLNTYQSSCIYQRLKRIYQEEVMKSHFIPQLHGTSYLLDKLLQKETLNMVIITLYPYSKGYSLSFCGTDGQIFQESQRTYAQDLLLDYIDKEELPPTFLDYWEQTFPELFYNGCVIVKVKDVRYTMEPQVRHVLLKPHTQSIINDINLIIFDESQVWSMEDKLSVEMSVVNAVQNPLCLDPSLETGIRRFHSHYVKNTFNTVPVRSSVVKHSQLCINRKRRQEDSCVRPNKHLINFIAKKKHLESLKCEAVISPSYKELDDLIPCREIDKDFKDVNQLARPIPKRNEESEVDYTPKLIEEYILEPEQQILKIEQKEPSKYRIKLEILQRPANSEYVGTLYVDNKYKEGENNGALCSFTLGSKANASRYIEQFTDIFTNKEGGKSVRITHSVPGQPTRETCTTTTMLEREPKNHTNLRIHSSGKAFMQIGANSTIGNLSQGSLRKHSKIQVQLQQGTAVKTVNAVGTVDGTSLSLTSNVMARIAKSALSSSQVSNKNLNSKDKIVARKMTITNSKIRPVISGITCSSMKKHITLPNQKVQEPMLNLAEINVGSLHHAISVSSLTPAISNLNVTNLKGFKSGILRNVHTIPATLEGSSTIQSPGLPTVHVVSGPKEKQIVSNGQSTVSSLSLSLPSLSALLADSSLATSQISLKKNGPTLDAP